VDFFADADRTVPSKKSRKAHSQVDQRIFFTAKGTERLSVIVGHIAQDDDDELQFYNGPC